MKKIHVSRKTAIRMMIIGGITYGLSLVLSFITLFRVYGEAGSDCMNGGACGFEAEQLMSRIALVAGYVGAAIALIGLVIFVVQTTKKKKP